jgi:hypothetical protein
MKTLEQKLRWLEKHTRCKVSKQYAGLNNSIQITVFHNQESRGCLVQKHKMINPGFFVIYYDWDKTSKRWKYGKEFGENQIDEAVAYAKERLFKQKSDPEPKELRKSWTVYEPKSYRGKSKVHYFDSFTKAESYYSSIYSELELT